MPLSGALQAGRSRVHDDGWLPIADLMAGLMMVFALFAVVSMGPQSTQTPLIDAEARSREAIWLSLQEALGEQLELWGAKLDRTTLSIDFGAPEINFPPGSTELNRRYRVILQDFFPRYLQALAPHRGLIDEVRIEGHASSGWAPGSGEAEAWFENMELSQQRTRAVLRYIYGLESVAPYRDWVRERVVAVGMSSARVVRNADGTENQARSRRVSFRMVTSAKGAAPGLSGRVD